MKNFVLTIMLACITTILYCQQAEFKNKEQNSEHPAISPYLFGQNYWMDLWEHRDVIFPLVKESGVKIIRIGGIGYDHDLAIRTNEEIESWVNDIKGAGAEPMLQVSRFADVSDAVRWVKYFNIETKNRIQYWNIGNEPDSHRPPGIDSIYYYIVKYAKAMKEVDPTISIFVPDLTGPHFQYLDRLVGGDRDITGLKINDVFLIDGISWHRYAFWKDYVRADVMDRVKTGYGDPTLQLKALIFTADSMHGRTGNNKLKWGIGEFNINVNIKVDSNPVLYKTVEGIGHHSFLSGQFYAELYGMCMEQGAFYAATWNIHEKGNRYTNDFGYLDGPMENPTPRSNYWHMWMLAHNFSGEYCKGNANQGNIKAYGCRDNGKISVMVINMDNDRDFDFNLRLDKQPVSGDKLLKINIDADLGMEFSGKIPNQTTCLMSFDKTGKLIKRITYSLKNALETKPPFVEEF
jgi:hypothetical protein